MNGKRFIISTIIIIFVLSCGSETPVVSVADVPFEMPEIQAPIFPSRIVNIVAHGAVGDAHTINTDAINAAIKTCANAGGGRVVIPRGIWMTGPIQLLDNIDLHLEKGATLQFIGGFENYPLMKGTWEGLAEVRCVSPIYGNQLENIAITGEGIIDGAGDEWRPVKKNKLTAKHWKQLVDSGGVLSKDKKIWWPSAGARDGKQIVAKLNTQKDAKLSDYAAAREYLRPVLINLVNCRNVLLDGPTFQNSPAWNIHPLLCENVIIRNITVRNPWYSQNGDGIDLESCKNVLLYDSRFDVGDDAICIKSGKNEYGRKRGIPTENIIIRDCVVYHGHGGFTVGSEMSGGVKNILVKDLTFLGTDVGLRFKSTRGRGGVVENIYIENILMQDIVMEAVRFNMFYENKAPIPEVDGDGMTLYSDPVAQPISEETPSFRNIHMKNVISRNNGQAILLKGLPELPIRSIHISDSYFSGKKGLVCIDGEDIQLRNLVLESESTPMNMLINSKNVLLEDVRGDVQQDQFLFISGNRSRDLVLAGKSAEIDPDKIRIDPELSQDILKFK